MDRPKTGFQDFPVEIRLMVYSHISPPLTSYLDYALKGLMLSCKETKTEMEHVIVANMKKYLDEMKKEWTETYGTTLRVSTPTTVLEVKQGITVTIPGSFFWLGSQNSPGKPPFPRPLLRLLPLHVDNITLKAGRNPLKYGLLDFHSHIQELLHPRSEPGDDPQFGVPPQPLCADSLTMKGIWGNFGARDACFGTETHSYWHVKREGDTEASRNGGVRKTWHRLSRLPDWPKSHAEDWQVEKLYSRNSQRRH
ncbi:hypothetical protein P171DRAFT_213343 [Karstenula rhodostoma CBS 690.94]|uniref:Uncharacterized protein n=1 Tax=Karstenula rhodostoma CBS 690.94 TaxID=1392251 RepID=A0A9P4PSD3_9PLEO|nr:hypothetical protein P171DRAFT_213343 [Karstenula rhodostoma CBS 690.94]